MKRDERIRNRKMLSNQTLEEIRQEITQAEMAGVTDEEYIAILTRHTMNLVELIEQLNSDTNQLNSLDSVLNLLFKNLAEPICVIDDQLNIILYNSCWKNLFKGHNRGYEINNLLSEKDFAAIKSSIVKAKKNGKREILALGTKKKKKIISILPFNGFDKKPKFLLFGLAQDIVDQIYSDTKGYKPSSIKTTEGRNIEQLKSSKYSALNLLGGFQFELDNKLSIQFTSPEIIEILGYKEKELLGKSINSILHKNYSDTFKETLKNYSSEDRRLRIEVELIDNEKKYRFYEITLSKTEDGLGWVGICQDIHRFKTRENELLRAKENAELNDKLKSDFLANMSHEIRTPLNGIVGFATMLERNHLIPEKREKYLRIIRSSTFHLLTLVSDIIDHTKIESGQLKIINHPVDIHQLLEDMQATFVTETQRLGKKHLRLIKQSGNPTRKLMIKSDEVRLKQVLSNLMGNALKFTSEGDIHFGYSLETPGSIRFFVKDNGVGLSKSAQQTIFRRFKQTKEGKKEKYNGTGLGLAISKGIVELMDGKIGVVSNPDEGSEFYFMLPLIECE